MLEGVRFSRVSRLPLKVGVVLMLQRHKLPI
jgi:hypothetical protein